MGLSCPKCGNEMDDRETSDGGDVFTCLHCGYTDVSEPIIIILIDDKPSKKNNMNASDESTMHARE